MSALQPPDAFENIAAEAILERQPDLLFGRSFWRIKKFTWGEGTTWRGTHEPGQRYAVDVDLQLGAALAGKSELVPGALISVYPLLCMDAQEAALKVPPDEHKHDDAVCRYMLHQETPVTKAWVYLDTKDAVLAALRWDPETETEPFGWHKALDGSHRIRPGGNPMQEITSSDALKRRE